MAKKIEIVAKTPYAGSGPRGVDVYATHLYNELSSKQGRDQIFLTRDKVEKSKKVDIVHYTFFDPFFLTLWGKPRKAKYIVTVHDLIPLKFPEHFPPGFKGQLKWFLQKLALQSASAIITDSECSKLDISSLTGISLDKIFVVPLAAGHTLVNEKMVKTVRKEYELPEKYLLYVGDINWNKNIVGLIKAFSKITSPTTHLVLVGKAFESGHGTMEYTAIRTAISQSGKEKLIHTLGFVPSHHLPAIYRGATLYVQPSWYEGFGFPVLEAMEQGTPVACSTAGSLKEVGGNFAHYFDPKKTGEMEAVISELLSNKQKREMYIENGRKWSRSFTWEKVVSATEKVYDAIIG